MTAVEWLADKVTDMIHESNHIELVSLLEQAKQMENEEKKLHNKCYPNSDEEWKQYKEQEDWYWEQLDNDFKEISDEEIEKVTRESAINYSSGRTYPEIRHISYANGFLEAIKWYREQLKNKQWNDQK